MTMALPQLRISPVVFNSDNHTYRLGNKYLKGVTGTLVRRAYPNTYPIPEGMTEERWNEILKNAASKGTAVHQALELYEDIGVESDIPELKNYILAKKENNLIHLASEYIVSDEEYYASAIDHVFCREDGSIVLVDIKHTAEIHWDEVKCQLSIYKKFFEMQNPDLQISALALLWLRDDKVVFQIINPFADEVIDELIKADIKDEQFDIQKQFGELPVMFANVEEQIAFLEADLKVKKKQYDELKAGLLEQMERYGIKKFTGSKVSLTRVLPTTRVGFDTKRLMAEMPDVYEQYKTETQIKSSIKISIK